MAFTATPTWGTPLSGAWTTAQLNTFVQSLALAFSGTVGGSDIAAGAIFRTHLTPDRYSWAAATFAGNTYTVNTLNGAGMPAANGVQIFFQAPVGGTNAAGGTFVNVNGQGVAALSKRGGQPLAAGDIRERLNYMIIRSADALGTVFWELVSLATTPDDHYESVVTTGTNDYVATFAPTNLALVDGLKVRWKVPNTNTTAARLNVDGLTLKDIRKHFNVALAAGDLVAGQTVETTYDATSGWWQLTSPIAVADKDSAVIGSARNLLIKNNGAAPNNKLDITADEVVMKYGTVALNVAAVNLSVDITASGANGLDTGAEGATTHYYIWLIHNGTAAASLISASSTAPTLPSGYVYKALVGWIYNDAGSNFIRSCQRDREVYCQNTNVLNDLAAAVPGTLESLDISTAVPPIAKTVWGTAGSGDVAQPARMSLSADANNVGLLNIVGQQNGAATNTFRFATHFRLPLLTAQVIYWTSGNAADRNRINVSGFTI